jgi:MYXO-CTERM domain-containing protein
MGLDASYPAVRINDPTASVPVWNGNRSIIGHLGPDDYYHSAAASVTCTLPRLNGLWYKLLNSTDWDVPATSAYVSAALTHLMYPGPQGYVLGTCPNNHDRPGRPPCWVWLIIAVAVIGVLRRRRRRQVVRATRSLGVHDRPKPDLPGLD